MEGLAPNDLEATFGWLEFVPFGLDHAYHAAELEADLRASSRCRDTAPIA